MSQRSKTLSLQRAYFNEGFNGTFEDVLRNTFAKLTIAEARTIAVDLFSSHLFASLEEATHGIFLRVLEFEQGAIGVINLNTTDNSVAVDEFFHPNKRNFLKEEIVCYVVRNHIVTCNMKNKGGTFAANVLQLARGADVLGGDVTMRIADVPDQTTLNRITEVGVKEIDFSITSYLENLNISTRKEKVARYLQMALGMPEDASKLRKRANTTGRVILKRGRFTKEEVHQDQWLTELGRELMADETSESFKIVLEDNTKVSNSMLKKSKSVKLPRHANSFSFDHAKKELEAYYQELAANRALDA